MKNLSVSVIREWLYVLTAFLMPFMPRFISVAIGLSFLFWLIELVFLKEKQKLKFQKINYVFLAFYLIYVAGLLWTENFSYGFFDLQIKLSLIVFPLMFLTVPLPGNDSFSRIVASFNFGCLVSVITVFVRAIIRQPDLGPEAFFYKELSWFLHPAYFSMYIGLSLSFILTRFITVRAQKISALSTIQVLLLTLTIMLLSSKAGIFVLLFIVILLVFYMLRSKSGFKLNLLIGAVFLIISTSLIFSQSIYGRLLEMKDSMTEENTSNVPESSAMRLMAWKVAIEVIKQNPFIGVGTGDVKDELMKGYQEHGYDMLFEQKVNAHNQFLQTMATLGISGGVLLICFFVFLLVQSVKKGKLIMMCFLIIVFFNAVVESILEVQAGVIFFSFFYCLLYSESMDMNVNEKVA